MFFVLCFVFHGSWFVLCASLCPSALSPRYRPRDSGSRRTRRFLRAPRGGCVLTCWLFLSLSLSPRALVVSSAVRLASVPLGSSLALLLSPSLLDPLPRCSRRCRRSSTRCLARCSRASEIAFFLHRQPIVNMASPTGQTAHVTGPRRCLRYQCTSPWPSRAAVAVAAATAVAAAAIAVRRPRPCALRSLRSPPPPPPPSSSSSRQHHIAATARASFPLPLLFSSLLIARTVARRRRRRRSRRDGVGGRPVVVGWWRWRRGGRALRCPGQVRGGPLDPAGRPARPRHQVTA